jgi:hypothetical protein
MAPPIEDTGTAGGACPPAGRRGCSTGFHCARRLSKGEGLPLRRDYETNLTRRKCLPPGGMRLRGATLKRSLGVPDISHAQTKSGRGTRGLVVGVECYLQPNLAGASRVPPSAITKRT